MSGTPHRPVRALSDCLRRSLRARVTLLFALSLILVGMSSGCGAARAKQARPAQPPPKQAGAEPEEKKQPQEERPKEGSPQEVERDEEDSVLARIAAAPEYLWKGLAYPFKRLAIGYERTDFMNRALDLFLNDERTGGVYPRFALGGALSSGLGFTAFNKNLFNQQKEGQLRYLLATRGNQTADFVYRDPSLLGSTFMFEADVFWLNFDNSFFYPGGNRASEGGKTHYALDQLSLNATFSHMVAKNLKASLLGRFLITDAVPSTRQPPTPATVQGINTYMQGLAVEPSLTYDSRDNPFRPSTGWYFDSGYTFTEQINRDQFRYMGYWVDVQRYIPAFRGNRVLLLRAYISKLDSVSGQAIPFYELNLLDVNNGLRAFDRGRWQDNGALLFNVEWRYPVGKDIEGTVFLDEGQVFRDYKDLRLKFFQYSAGAGFRFVTARKFSFRMQVAVSNDGLFSLIRADLEFLRRRGTVLGGF
jgi:hypothetical protein